MPYVKSTDGTEIHALTYGEGPDVVLIHGWPLSYAMWEYQVADLVAAGNRVTTYCRRGFGHSGKPWTGYNYDTMTDDLAAVMESAGVRDAALVGFSMGGGEVARYMTRHDGKSVRSAVLVSAVTPYMLKTDDNPDGVDGQIFEDMKNGLKADRPKFLSDFNQDFFGQGSDAGGVSDALLHDAVRVAMQASPKATIDCVDAFGKTDFRPDMEAFKLPTLNIHGTGDKTVPFGASAKRAAQMIKGAELKTYDGAPHALVNTHTEQFNQDLIAFLKT